MTLQARESARKQRGLTLHSSWMLQARRILPTPVSWSCRYAHPCLFPNGVSIVKQLSACPRHIAEEQQCLALVPRFNASGGFNA